MKSTLHFYTSESLNYFTKLTVRTDNQLNLQK